MRQAPVTVTPHVPSDCPIVDARTRILERRQTEDGFGRNFYLVEMTYLGGQEPTSTWVQSSDDGELGGTEVERVDVSRILHYVSSRELERFENEQFRVEAEAQAVAEREEEEEQVRRRMEKNARMAGSGRGRGSRMLDGLGIDPELRTTSMLRGRPRGRGRGRGRGGGGGSWRGRGGTTSRHDLRQDEIVDSEPSQTYTQRPPTSRDEVKESSLESEDDLPEPTLPCPMRSAFVANSALPLSPVQPHRPAPTALRRAHREILDITDTDTTSDDHDNGSMASAAMPLQSEGNSGDITTAESESPDSDQEDAHRSKRPRTESVGPQHTLMFPPSSQVEDSESEDESIPADPPSTIKAHKYHDATLDACTTPRAAPSPSYMNSETGEIADDSQAEDAEEYVVESIIEHYYDQGRKYYLVKWEGYEDSHDWLPEEDLEGAAELVKEYNERVKRRKAQERAR